MGGRGSYCYGKDEPLAEVPAMAGHFVDRIGAGDAVFAVTSLCMHKAQPAPVLGVIGNAVGAMAVGTVGNGAAIDNVALMKFLASVLK